MKMPITIIAITLATAPMTVPTALVRRVIPPSSCVPRSGETSFGIRPRLAANERIAKLRRTRPLDVRLDGRRTADHQLFLSDLPARPERSAWNQVSGFHHSVVPSNENVMNSARPPIFSHGTGPPRPPSYS